MNNVDNRAKRAVLVSLSATDNGYVISLDDTAKTGVSDLWQQVEHVTRKEISKEHIDSLSLPESELASLGYYVLARLHAFKTMGEI